MSRQYYKFFLLSVCTICFATTAWASGNPGLAVALLIGDAIGLSISLAILLVIYMFPKLNLTFSNLLLCVGLIFSVVCNLGFQMLFGGFFKSIDSEWSFATLLLIISSLPFLLTCGALIGRLISGSPWIFFKPILIFSIVVCLVSAGAMGIQKIRYELNERADRSRWQKTSDIEKGLIVEAKKKGLYYSYSHGLMGKGFFPEAGLHKVEPLLVNLTKSSALALDPYGNDYYQYDFGLPKFEVVPQTKMDIEKHLGMFGKNRIVAQCERPYQEKQGATKEKGDLICLFERSTLSLIKTFPTKIDQASDIAGFAVVLDEKSLFLLEYDEKGANPRSIDFTLFNEDLEILRKGSFFVPAEIGHRLDMWNFKLLASSKNALVARVYNSDTYVYWLMKIDSNGSVSWYKKFDSDIDFAEFDFEGNLYLTKRKRYEEGNSALDYTMLKVLANGEVDSAYSEKWSAFVSDKATMAKNAKIQNPFADFENKFKVGQNGKVLASNDYLTAELERRNFTKIDRVLPVFESNDIPKMDFQDFSSTLTVNDVRLNPDGHIHIIGKFMLQHLDEVWINYADIGPLDRRLR